MQIPESQTLLIGQLISYARLPIKHRALVDPATGEFLMMLKKRYGCPLSEKELKQQLSDNYRHILRDLPLDRENKLEIRRELAFLSVNELAEQLSELLQLNDRV